jgi:hypothetical protein
MPTGDQWAFEKGVQLTFPSQEPPCKRERDVCQNRHMGNEQSMAAHEKNALGRPWARTKVYEWFCSNSAPKSAQEAAIALAWPINRISPRISELKRDKWLVQAGLGLTDTNSSCALYVALSADERAKLIKGS